MMEPRRKYLSRMKASEKMNFSLKYKSLQDNINTYIDSIIPKGNAYLGSILDSMRYSLFAGGKRLRPVLMCAAGELFGYGVSDLLPYCAGIEMIHTYSLIHDDLPAIDNDDYRRGRPSNHKIYGEAMAILAGDCLLNLAFEHMLDFACKKGEVKYTEAVLEIARASGLHGMIGGQVIDIENTGRPMDKDKLDFMHSNKTGALIAASVKIGAIISGSGHDDYERLLNYGHELGLAFQIIDDILDVIGDESKLGKKTGSDTMNAKTTYVSIYGIDYSMEAAKRLSDSALSHLEYYGSRADFLRELTNFLLKREY